MDRATRGAAGADVTGAAGPADDATRISYRSLRVSVVALALLLTTSLVLEIARSGGRTLDSISAYYYSPARSVLVGSLVAIGLALIAVKGRRGWEDVLLDLAGMVLPVVALVPSSLDLGADVCGAAVERCVPPDLVPAVQNNVTALLVVGAVGLAFAGWATRHGRDVATSVGLGTAAALWAAAALWFWLGPAGFLARAHYVAAVVFFALIAVVAFLNGRLAPQRHNVPLVAPRRYGQAYRAIGGLMVLTILVALGLLTGDVLLGMRLPPSTTFVVESVLMALFVAFWTVQTVENWDEEAEEADHTRRARAARRAP